MNAADLEKKAEKALIFLHEGAMEHAQARANANYLDDYLKVEIARLKGAMVGSQSDAAKTQMALEHPDYRKALEARRIAEEIHYTNVFKREAAVAVLSAWQTCSANERRSI